MRKKIVAIMLALVLILTITGCQNVSGQDKPTVAVFGSGKTKSVPDQVQIAITIATEKRDATAQTDNAAKVAKIVEMLKALGLEEKEIQTTGANFYPNKRWENGREVDLGFRAESYLQVETKKMDLISQIIDQSVANGAERVGGLSFTLSEEARANMLSEVLESAVQDARMQAEVTAKALGKSIDGVKTVQVIKEQSYPIYRAMDMVAGKGEAASTPILPGEVDYMINVSVEFFLK